MSNKKDVVINVEPFHCEIFTHTYGFTLRFISDMGNGRRKIVNLKFEYWWVRYIAKDLWKAITFWRTEVERCADGLKDDPNE